MDNNKILGIVLIVLGALLVLNWIRIPFLTEVVGIGLIVLGILMLMGRFGGGTILGIVAIVLGALVLVGRIPGFVDVVGDIWRILTLVVGILLIVFGALKVLGKR